MSSINLQLDPQIEAYIDAYEERAFVEENVDLVDFLPDRDDPLFERVASELIRIDMELAWEAGRRRSLSDYSNRFPELAANDDLRSDVAFEEYRQRNYHGESVAAKEISERYGVSPENWSTVVESLAEGTRLAGNFDELAEGVPKPGQRWRDFEILREIGRGRLSRVLLAKQTSLSGREVVLKFAPKNMLEANKLARLQHQNIVPVFSVYEDRDFHVFCTPFLASETLSDALASADGRFDEELTVDLLRQLANAIDHAHGRGILHNDIKPANVLWVGGRPMLLDFNLAADTQQDEETHVGGTLAYMSPESLRGLARNSAESDERSDIFSLGAVVYELLVGRSPLGAADSIDEAVASREKTVDLSLVAASPGMVSILSKCLAINGADRYQSAAELLTDVERHQRHLPLQHAANTSFMERVQKWGRRHPRIASLSSMLTLGVVMLTVGGLAWSARERHVGRLEAEALASSFHSDADGILASIMSTGLDVVDTQANVAAAEELLGHYLDDKGNYRQSESYRYLSEDAQLDVDQQIAKLSVMTAASLTAEKSDIDSILQSRRFLSFAEGASGQRTKAQLIQSAKLFAMQGDNVQAKAELVAAGNTEVRDANDLQAIGWLQRFEKKPADAVATLTKATDQQPGDYTKWYNLSQAYVDVSDWEEADHCLSTCLALQSDSAVARYVRALCRRELRKPELAIADFSAFLAVHPDDPNALLNRAIAYKEAGRYELALADIDTAIGLGRRGSRPLLIRSRVRKLLGDHAGSKQDLKDALAATPKDDIGWVARGVAQMSKPQLAIADFEKAISLNPRSQSARMNMAYLLSELGRNDDAIGQLDQLIAHHPLDDSAYGGRGVLLARVKKFDQAIDDAKKIVSLNGRAMSLLQAACIYSMASPKNPDHQKKALTLLGQAFKLDPELGKLATDDPDLEAIHDVDAYAELCKAARVLAKVPNSVDATE